jgi:flagellar hook-associated protein 3
MGTSLSQVYSDVSYALNRHTAAITSLQEQASTGNRVNRASDDPSSAYRILGLNSESRSLANYIDTITTLADTLEMSTTVIESMYDQLSDVETALTQITGGVYDQGGREEIADEIDNILEQLFSLANTEVSGRYLFGGSNTTTAPYVATRDAGAITSVTYQGSHESLTIDVADGLATETNVVGDDLFRMNDRQTPTFLGTTGAQAGTGTSTVTGIAWLTVASDGTNYRLSIDDGATYVNVAAGATNVAVTDSRTGEVLYVDAANITGTGVEMVQVDGTYDVFDTLISLRNLLTNDTGLSAEQVVTYVNDCLGPVESLYDMMVEADVSVGSKVGFLQTLSDTLDTIKSNVEDQTTTQQEADAAELAIELSEHQTLYQMSLSVANAVLSMSLWDFMD